MAEQTFMKLPRLILLKMVKNQYFVTRMKCGFLEYYLVTQI